MKEKSDIVRDWLPRYTGRELADFGSYILAIGIDALIELRDSGESVKHLRFES